MTPRVLAACCVAALVLAGCGGDDGPGTVQPYDRAPVPAVPDRTHEVPEAGDLPDGDYWAVLSSASPGAGTIALQVSQALFADTCLAELGEAECEGDWGVVPTPTRSVVVPVATLVSISVAAENRQNYAVPGAELASLASGGTPAADAPEGYAYQPYPFLVAVEAGAVVGLHQVWVDVPGA
ncbi:MAG: hypothetical protein Q7V57_08485 [Actinomycetota bacterium]|nr:hypothetical protein [Actinomycetota bacterium]